MSTLEPVGAFRGRAKRKDMHVAAWKLNASRIVDFKGHFGFTTSTTDPDVSCFDLKVVGCAQLPHLVHDLTVVPSLSGGVPRKIKQIFIKSVLLQVHGDDSVRQVTGNG